MKQHPSEEKLALYAGGDLGPLERWGVRRHLDGCAQCRTEAAKFEIAGNVLADEAAQVPEGVEWGPLAREMAANIRLGLAAGEIVAPAHKPQQRLFWRPAAVAAASAGLLVTAWWLNLPQTRTPVAHVQPAVVGTLLQETDSGIEVKSVKGSLTLLRPRSASAAVQLSTPGSLRERYVDDETGQVTINNVYAE